MSRSDPRRWRLSLCLAGLAAVLGTAAADQLGRVPNLPDIEAPEAEPESRSETQWETQGDSGLPPLESLRETLARPLFRPSRRAPEPAVVATAAPIAAPLDYGLVGVLLFDGRRVALVRPAGGGRILRVSEGQRLGQWRVTRIDPTRLEARSSGRTQALRLKDEKHPVVRAATRRTPDSGPAVESDTDEQGTTEAAIQ